MTRIKARVVRLERHSNQQRQGASETQKRRAICAALDCLELALGRNCFTPSPYVAPGGGLVYRAEGGHLWAHSPTYGLWERTRSGNATPEDHRLLGAVHERLTVAGLAPVDFLALLVADEIHNPDRFTTAEQQPADFNQQPTGWNH